MAKIPREQPLRAKPNGAQNHGQIPIRKSLVINNLVFKTTSKMTTLRQRGLLRSHHNSPSPIWRRVKKQIQQSFRANKGQGGGNEDITSKSLYSEPQGLHGPTAYKPEEMEMPEKNQEDVIKAGFKMDTVNQAVQGQIKWLMSDTDEKRLVLGGTFNTGRTDTTRYDREIFEIHF